MNILKKCLTLVAVSALVTLTQCMEYTETESPLIEQSNKKGILARPIHNKKISAIKQKRRLYRNLFALEHLKNDLRKSVSQVGLDLKKHHSAMAKIKPRNNQELLLIKNIANSYVKLQIVYNNITNKQLWRTAKCDLSNLNQLTDINDYTYNEQIPRLATLAEIGTALATDEWDLAENHIAYNFAVQQFLSYRDEQEQKICSIS